MSEVITHGVCCRQLLEYCQGLVIFPEIRGQNFRFANARLLPDGHLGVRFLPETSEKFQRLAVLFQFGPEEIATEVEEEIRNFGFLHQGIEISGQSRCGEFFPAGP
jgi:hypothetical protein